MPIGATANQERRRKIDDIGRALKVLLGQPNANAAELASKYVDLKEMKFIDSGQEFHERRHEFQGMLPFRFFPNGLIKFGGTGVIFQVENVYDSHVKYGIKLARPSFLDSPAKDYELFTQSRTEFLNHAGLLHNNVVRIIGTTASALIENTPGKLTHYHPIMMEWIDTPTPLWPAPGSADTELGVLLEPEVCHGETKVYTRVQA